MMLKVMKLWIFEVCLLVILNVRLVSIWCRMIWFEVFMVVNMCCVLKLNIEGYIVLVR